MPSRTWTRTLDKIDRELSRYQSLTQTELVRRKIDELLDERIEAAAFWARRTPTISR